MSKEEFLEVMRRSWRWGWLSPYMFINSAIFLMLFYGRIPTLTDMWQERFLSSLALTIILCVVGLLECWFMTWNRIEENINAELAKKYEELK